MGLPRRSLDSVNVGNVKTVSALRRDFAVAEGSTLSFDWNFLTNENRNGDFAFVFISDSDSIVKLADSTSSLVGSTSSQFPRETGFDTFTHAFDKSGTFTIGIGVAQAIDRGGDSAIILDNFKIDDERYSSLQTRQEFNIDVVPSLSEMKLQVQYDDGFAAFINGQLVASENAPAELVWNATAPNIRPDNAVANLAEFTVPVGVLRPGNNVLAIQGLNSGADQNDFLIDAQLIGISTVAEEPSYLQPPTPNAENITTNSPVQIQFDESIKFACADPI